MADEYQVVLDNLALLIGGTIQNSPPPGFYSGAKAGDNSGVSGLKGCYSRPPESFGEGPVGIILPSRFTAVLSEQGYEDNYDTVRLVIFPKQVDMATDFAILTPFRGAVPAMLATHFQNDTVPGATALTTRPLYQFAKEGNFTGIKYQGNDYFALEFKIEIRRKIGRVYVS